MCEVCIVKELNSRVLLHEGYDRVCVVDGGYFAIHETIRRFQKMEWLIDHDSSTCEGWLG